MGREIGAKIPSRLRRRSCGVYHMIGLGDSEGQRGKGEAVRGSGHGARMSLLQLTLVALAEADGALRERPGGGATERGLVVVPLGETESAESDCGGPMVAPLCVHLLRFLLIFARLWRARIEISVS